MVLFNDDPKWPFGEEVTKALNRARDKSIRLAERAHRAKVAALVNSFEDRVQALFTEASFRSRNEDLICHFRPEEKGGVLYYLIAKSLRLDAEPGAIGFHFTSRSRTRIVLFCKDIRTAEWEDVEISPELDIDAFIKDRIFKLIDSTAVSVPLPDGPQIPRK